MLENIDTLEKARNHNFRMTLEEASKDSSRPGFKFGHKAYSLGAIDFFRPDTEGSKNFREVLNYIVRQLPPIRIVPWKYIKPKIDAKEIQTFGQLHHNAIQYQRYVHHGWTASLRPNHPLGGGAMDFMNYDDEYQKISTISDHPDCNELDDEEENSVNSVYYHAAKGHWLVNNIQKEGLRHPIQGHTNLGLGSGFKYKLSIHPGSIRCKVFETMDEPEFQTIVTDYADCFPECKALSGDELISFWEELSMGSESKHNTLSAIWVDDGKLEFSLSSVAGLNFREEVFEFNKKVTKLTKKKPVNIYLGYDSNHSDLFDVAEKSIHDSIENIKSGGVAEEYFNDYKVEVKKLDINAISEYTREYANQSTEFTYSRFLIPYLENYEGFSFFIDDDYIWKHNPMSLFYFLDPDNAVACVQYDFKHHDENKMGGEKNVSYPMKLWSSMMIFNNGHEDCRKLTPEVVNNESGMFLHQFKWTDKISKIPHDKICTEGYDDSFNETHHAIHYTRGGPWIKDMDYSHINMLDLYEKHKRGLPNST
tara:strand:- start:62 stop:1666 length:1605 start_codon:yes stop_codon:yes gene_type:complete